MNKNYNNPGEKEIKQSSPTEMKQLTDMFSRSISYLRISLTDHCNLRCLYCTPKGDGAKLLSGELLSYEEILRLVRLAVSMGIKKVRLTGGEPLVRHGVLDFIRNLSEIEGLDDIRLTTNGVLLADYAEDLYATGIRKLNISLDTMKPERFKEITGVDVFAKVGAGIIKARELGFSPIKLNVVALRGVNDDEFIEFGKLTLTEPLQVRFIEFMPIGGAAIWDKKNYISSTEIMTRLKSLGELVPVAAQKMDGPARIYRFEQAAGSVGFISPISHHFCDRCNRLRLTSEGKLRSCLLSDKETDIKTVLRSGASDDEVLKVIVDTIVNKPKGHTLSQADGGNCHGRMSRIGG